MIEADELMLRSVKTIEYSKAYGNNKKKNVPKTFFNIELVFGTFKK